MAELSDGEKMIADIMADWTGDPPDSPEMVKSIVEAREKIKPEVERFGENLKEMMDWEMANGIRWS